MNEAPHMETLRVIRRITADGILTTDEVWDLTQYLNESRDARNSWPGNVLWSTLQSIFDDGVVTDDELEVLGAMLVDVGTQCADMGNLGLTTYIRVQSRKVLGRQPATETGRPSPITSERAEPNP